ncbi:SIMPL domain-containing protein [bacterium]|nr:SIMPL domain-containing protein [bacterium]
MKTALLLLTALISTTAWAGKFEIIGEGTSSKPAEFVRVKISVVSECHASALDARQDVDQLTQKAIAALQVFKTDLPEQLSVSPEGNSQKVKTAYIQNETVIICDEDHSWNSSTVIQFKLNNLLQLAELQDALLKLNGRTPPLSAINQPRLALSLSQPTPGVLAETWDAMSDLALKRAHANALRQVKVLSEGMLNPKVELQKVATTNASSGQVLYDRVDSEGDTSGASLGTVSLKLSRQFTFKVEEAK